ncbi:hypothetical protein ACTFIU_009460 [Dictyostelium citrinum]
MLSFLNSNYEELDQKRIQISTKLRDTEGKGIYLNEQKRVELETKLRELGIQKTKIRSLKSKCLQLIDETKQGKELIDNGINLVLENEDNLKLLYLNNGLTLKINKLFIFFKFFFWMIYNI